MQTDTVNMKHNNQFNIFRTWSYQIKENHKCINIVANILPIDPPPRYPGDGLVGQNSFFQNMVMLHINIKGITECSNMVANI